MIMKKIFIILFILLLDACSSSKNVKDLIKVEQIESIYPVEIYATKSKNRIHAINYPLTYRIKKTNAETTYLIRHGNYYYGNKYCYKGHWYGGGTLFLCKDGMLKEDVEYLNTDYNEYVAYTHHYDIDSTKSVQQMFQPYLEKMKQENKDTLHIESIQELKKINPELINGFLQGDSIRFRFRYGKKYGTITLPVEVK